MARTRARTAETAAREASEAHVREHLRGRK